MKKKRNKNNGEPAKSNLEISRLGKIKGQMYRKANWQAVKARIIQEHPQ